MEVRPIQATINLRGLQTVLMLGGFASITLPAKSYLAEARPMFGKRNQRPSTLNSSPLDGTMVLLLPGHWQGVIYPEENWGGGGGGAQKGLDNGETVMGQLLFITSPGECNATEEIGGVLVGEDTSELIDQAWTISDSEVVSPCGVQATLPNLLASLFDWERCRASICPAWNLDPFAPVCIDTPKDDGSDVLRELIPCTAEWPSPQREYLCCVLFTPWFLNFVKSNYICQARIVFHNLMLLTVYTYTSYVQIFFIQVRLTEQLPDSSAFLLEF